MVRIHLGLFFLPVLLPAMTSALAVPGAESPLERRVVDTSQDPPLDESFLDDVPIADGGTEEVVPIDPSKTSKRAKSAAGEETVAFTDENETFQRTFDSCSTKWGQVLGTWTFFNGTTSDVARWVDIYRDTCQHAGIPGNHGQNLDHPDYLTSLNIALTNNANLAMQEHAALPASYKVCMDTATEPYDQHVELRKLLALPHNYWTFLFVTAGITGGINTALYQTAYPNNTVWQKFEAGVSAGILVLVAGIIGWVASLPAVANVDRHLAAGSGAATRRVGRRVLQASGSLAAGLNNLGSSGGNGNGDATLPTHPEGVAVGASSSIGTDSDAGTCLTEIIVQQAIGAVSTVTDETDMISPFSVVRENIAALGRSQSCPI